MTGVKIFRMGVAAFVVTVWGGGLFAAVHDSREQLVGNSTIPSGEYLEAAATNPNGLPFGLTNPLANGPIQLHGFLSAGAAITNTPAQYYVADRGNVNNNINFNTNTLIGIQLEAHMTEQLSVIAQMLADGDSTSGARPYVPTVQWAFLKYEISPDLQVRAGRFRVPLFLYSNTIDVGVSYPEANLPNEVYRVVTFYNANGADAIFTHALGDSTWNITIQPFVGSNQSQLELPFPTGILLGTFSENNLWGVAGELGSPFLGIRGSYAQTNLSGTIPTPSGGTMTLFSNQLSRFYEVGGQMNYNNVVINAEYAARTTPAQVASLAGYYVFLGYRIKQILPNFTYGHLITTNTSALQSVGFGALAQAQQSLTAGLDYYISAVLVAKGSVSWINPLNGTNGLFTSNPGKPWVNLYNLSLSVIF